MKNSIGSFATATCTTCKYKVDAEHIREKIFNQEIPYCEKCQINKVSEEQPAFKTVSELDTDLQPKPEENTEPAKDEVDPQLDLNEDATAYKKNNSAGILKPDIVFFGEGLPELYHQSIAEDKSKCDLLIVIGSSLKVKPVANIPHMLPQNIPQILINRESLKHLNFDIELLGDCDVIVNELLLRLEEKQRKAKDSMPDDAASSLSMGYVPWSDLCKAANMLREITDEEAECLLFSKKPSDEHQPECGSGNSSLDNSTVIFGDVNKKEVEEEPKVSETQEQREASDDKSPEEETTAEEPKADEVRPQNKKYTKDYLKESSFLYLKPNMYIFHGAEVQLRYTRKKLLKLNKKYAEDDGVAKSGVSDDEDESDESSDMTDSDDSDDSDDEDDEVSDEEEEVSEVGFKKINRA